jgi:hypothetical protein
VQAAHSETTSSHNLDVCLLIKKVLTSWDDCSIRRGDVQAGRVKPLVVVSHERLVSIWSLLSWLWNINTLGIHSNRIKQVTAAGFTEVANFLSSVSPAGFYMW